jgi:hypothetical protein
VVYESPQNEICNGPEWGRTNVDIEGQSATPIRIIESGPNGARFVNEFETWSGRQPYTSICGHVGDHEKWLLEIVDAESNESLYLAVIEGV